MNFKIYLVLILLTCNTLLLAQRKVTLPPPIEHKIDSPYKGENFRYQTFNYNIYSNFHVNGFASISIDSEGRFWGTSQQSGFCSFDGTSLFIYGSVNGFYDRFKEVASDNKGRTWIGGNGIGVASPSRGLTVDWYVDIGLTISDGHIRSVNTDSRGYAWISTHYGGISCITPDTTYFFNTETCDLPDTKFGPAAVDGKDRYWFISEPDNQIFYIENKEPHQWSLHEEKGIKLSNLNSSPDEYLIAWDKKSNVYKIGIDFIEKIEIKDPEHQIEKIEWFKFDPIGQAYFGDRQKIFKLVNGNAQLIIDARSAETNILSPVFDENGGIWFTSSKGVYYVPSQNICHFPKNKIRGINPSLQLYQNDLGELMSLNIDKDRNFNTKKLFTDDFAKGDQLAHILECPAGYIIKDTKGKKRFINLKGEENEVPAVDENAVGRQIHTGIQLLWSFDKPLQLIDDKNEVTNTGMMGKHHKLIYKKEDGTHYFLSDTIGDFYKIWSYKNGESRIIMNHIMGDTMRIEGAHYVNDTTFLLATWGYYAVTITPHTTSFKIGGFGTNILYTCDNDSKNNFWTSGIEGGLNYVDALTDSVININQNDGLKGGRVSNFYIAGNDELVICTIVGVGYLKIIDPNVEIHTKADFFKKYQLIFYDSRSGLMGEGFGGPRLDDQGRIWTINKDSEWQLIFGRDSTHGPKHLKFQSIQSIDRSNSKKYFQFWLPGTEYIVNDHIEINYDEELLINLKAIYFRDVFALNYQCKIDDRDWSAQQSSSTFQLSNLGNGEHEISFRAISPDKKISNEIVLKVVVIPPFYETAWFIFLMIFLGIGIIYSIFRWRTHVMRLRQRILEKTVDERTKEIKLQKIEIETQHNEIKDSISYAKRIQEAILPPTELVNKCLPENFILYKPKDVVAGDFYWLEEVGELIIFAAADCTGHGVPGAMVSVVCHNALNRAVREFGCLEPNLILDKTRDLVLQRFESGKQEVNDGMDIAVCTLNKKTNELKFSGANNGLYLIRNGELQETKGDKQPIGKFHDPKPFEGHSIQLEKEDTFYLYTDGFADQFGGDKGKKLKSSHFKQLLLEKHKLNLKEQVKVIDAAFEEWKGELEQVDDICVIGVRI
ncbi:MAG: SpoIIE family protein phosphatase [Crocinitomicaceae bacterium]|nr:SpoIIE family protein phosphatase [Crocinitomicaceae bacterium]